MKPIEKSLAKFILHPETNNFSVITGRTFRKGPLIRGIGSLLFGLLLFYGFILALIDSNSPLNLIVLLFSLIFTIGGSLILFAMEGVEIDAKRKQIKEFMQFIGKFGSWQSIEKYPYIAIIKENKTVYYGSYVGTPSFQWKYSNAQENEEFEVCLLNRTHYKRIGLYFTKDFADAREKCEQLTKILGIEFTEFNPVRISKRKSRKK